LEAEKEQKYLSGSLGQRKPKSKSDFNPEKHWQSRKDIGYIINDPRYFP
jgi:hypothetical protein